MRASHLHRATTGRGITIGFGLLTDNQCRQILHQRSQHTIMIVPTNSCKHKMICNNSQSKSLVAMRRSIWTAPISEIRWRARRASH